VVKNRIAILAIGLREYQKNAATGFTFRAHSFTLRKAPSENIAADHSSTPTRIQRVTEGA
jgi:hypothetical protein